MTIYKKDTDPVVCPNKCNAPTVKFVVVNAATGAFSTIVMEPHLSSFNGGAVPKDTWLTLNVGKDTGSSNCTRGVGWWATKSGQNIRCAPAALLNQLTIDYPLLKFSEAKIRSVAIEMGTYNAGVTGYVQTLRVSSSIWDYTWVFNPT